MTSSTLKIIGCLLVISLIVHAQNQPTKTVPATVSGKVTHKGNGMARIVVGARRVNGPAGTVVATTDEDGNYRMSNIPAGEYEIMPASAQFVMPQGIGRIKRLIVNEGESVEKIDFALVRGGVITGKVTDAEGRPVIEVPVEVVPESFSGDPMADLRPGDYATDDRGIYRLWGLSPGKYRVAAGASEDRMYYGRRQAFYSQTFHPSAPDPSGATVIELTEGGEVTNVDITLRRTQSVFTVTARVVDGDTGQPIPDLTYGLQKFRENASSSTSGHRSNRSGVITLENVTPGKYALFVESSAQRQLYAEPVQFEVVDQDIKDLVIKTSSGSTVSGEVVIEGMEERVARGKLDGLVVHAFVMIADDRFGHGASRSGRVNADGSFTLSGLRPGTINFSIWHQRPVPRADLDVARIERDGVVLPSVEIKAREQIKGLRLILRTRSGRIRGMVKFENGPLPGDAPVQVQIRKIGEERYETYAEVDDRGRFVSDHLAAGVYEVSVFVYGLQGRPRTSKQEVVVSDNQVSEITLTLDLKADVGQGRP